MDYFLWYPDIKQQKERESKKVSRALDFLGLG